METVTRFAPSPNGSLHLGHAYSAIVAHDLARDAGGRFLLRIEDIDGARSRPELADEFRRDLEWLGLEWEEVPPQSTRIASYETAFAKLRDAGLVYPCCCTRKDTSCLSPSSTAATSSRSCGLASDSAALTWSASTPFSMVRRGASRNANW